MSSFPDIRGDFPILSRRVADEPIVYLDSAATSLKPQVVIDAVTDVYRRYSAGVHRAVHPLAEEATNAFENSRATIARFFRADEGEIVFTRGATESINLLRSCLPGARRALTTAIEHHSNFLPWAYGDDSQVVTCDAEGRLDMEAFHAALERGVDLVAVTHLSNVLGSTPPIDEIVEAAHAAGAFVLLDAAQSSSHMPVDVKQLDVDFMVCSGHKMLGPSGVGLLYGKLPLLERLAPWHLGGSMVDQVHLSSYTTQGLPHRLEAGTPALEGVVGWGAAVRYLDRLGMEGVETHSRLLADYAVERLSSIEHVQVVGTREQGARLALVSFHVRGLEAHGVARMLGNRANLLVRSGFLCAQPLHEALQIPPSVRASFHVYNTRQDVDLLAAHLESITSFVRR